MTKKEIVNPENPNGVLVDMTSEEETQNTTDIANNQARIDAEETAKTDKENLKASAKAKLISGEALTEDEANTIVL
jgi:hypothetical protein